MKANEAPEKIYVPTTGDEIHYHMTSPKNEFKESIEYTHTEALINKGCNFIRERLRFDDNAWYTEGEVTLKDRVIENFKDYMKGE